MKEYWISYETKNVPRDKGLWKNIAYATALGARIRLTLQNKTNQNSTKKEDKTRNSQKQLYIIDK